MNRAFLKCIKSCSNGNYRTNSIADINRTLNTRNPNAESNEYIDSIRQDVEYFGLDKERTTFSFDKFETLQNLTLEFMNKELVYVYDMSKSKMEIQRELAIKQAIICNYGQNSNIKAPVSLSNILPSPN